MLIGNFQHGFDKKGRMIIPAKFRADLGERFIATKGVDNCITIYPQEEWIKFEAKIKALPSTKDSRAFSRFFFSGAAECEVDKQGRVLIPAHLREYAKIEKDAVINGVSDRVEVWSSAAWEAYTNSELLSPESIAEKMEGLGGI